MCYNEKNGNILPTERVSRLSKKKRAQKAQEEALRLSKRKKYMKYAVLLLISAVAALLIIPRMVYRANQRLVEQEALVEDIDVSFIAEKTLTGSYSTAQMSASVEVTIVNGQYESITLTDSSGINPARARQVIQAILTYQTLTPEVGDIGTQYTDIIVQKAVYYAIRYNYSTS